MRDEELRDELVSWLRPAQQLRPPDISVIRRRLRRRRARNAAAGLAAGTVIAASAGLIHVTSGGSPAAHLGGGPPAAVPGCPGNHLRISWSAAPVRNTGPSMEPLPIAYLLQLRNTGPVSCSLEGWPRLAVTRPRSLRSVPISYGTVSLRSGRRAVVWAVVEPTRVVLRPGASAAARVMVTYPFMLSNCSRPAWTVTPPGGRTSTLLPQGPASSRTRGQGVPMLCTSSTVVASPVYPGSVPNTQNYPPGVPAQAPASVSTSSPGAGAGPGAAPYFIVVHVPLARVYDWRTGKVVATVRPPATARQSGGFTGVAAAGDDQTFVLAAGQHPSRFYQLVLARGGVPRPLTPLPVPPVATPGTPFAVSDDGSQLALALPRPGSSAPDEIMVVSLVTGATNTWQSPDLGLVTGMSWADPGSSPARSWAGNARLAFGWTDTAPHRRVAASRSGLRLLDPAALGTDLLASRLLIPASARFGTLRGLANPLISSGGTVVFATMTSHASGNAVSAVVEFSTATGRPLRAVTPQADESGFGTWCGALWTDPSGLRALAACGTQGEIDGGLFRRANLHFPAPNFSAGQDLFAW